MIHIFSAMIRYIFLALWYDTNVLQYDMIHIFSAMIWYIFSAQRYDTYFQGYDMIYICSTIPKDNLWYSKLQFALFSLLTLFHFFSIHFFFLHIFISTTLYYCCFWSMRTMQIIWNFFIPVYFMGIWRDDYYALRLNGI